MKIIPKLYFTLLLLLFFFPVLIFSQKKQYIIKGVVTDINTSEVLMDVPIGIKEIPQKGTITDNTGYYSLTLPEGNYTIVISYIGYGPKEVKLSLNQNITQNISLEPSSVELGDVIVSAKSPDQNVISVQTGVEHMEIKEANKLPVLLGERDIIKSLQLLPGIQSTGEGSSGLFIRGGSSDQNLILLDHVELYNASHLMGFFSTFNSDVIRDVMLYKGMMPSQYGGRLAAIMDVQQRNGNNQNYGISGGIGLISSKINIEGPIQKGKSSFIFGARRTYADAIARLSGAKEAKDAYLYFYDLNFRGNIYLSSKDQLIVSGYYGKDKMVLRKTADTDWGNLIGAIKWSRQLNNKWQSATTLSYNQYGYHAKADFGMSMKAESKISDITLKEEFTYQHSNNTQWRIGLQTTRHKLDPGDIWRDTVNINLYDRYAAESAIYANNQIKLSNNLEVIYGLRASLFSVLGKGEYYTIKDGIVTDSIWYKSGKVVKRYFNLEPRISAVYKLDNSSSVKAAYARTTQNMHLLNYSTKGTPYDRWTMSSNNVKPQIGDQYSFGYFRNFDNNAYEFSVETYYKGMRNQIDFKDNADFTEHNVIETEILSGKGRSYGIEILLKKRTGKLTGWIGYTLSKTEKKINGINNDKWYNAYQDRTHEISIVAMYDLNKKWSFSAAWVYYTGNALTYPSGKYQIDGENIMYYAERNGYRAPAYHRLDLGATCVLKKTKKYYSELALSLYNAYGRENAYMIEFRRNDDDPSKTSAYQYSLFRFVPSISWNFKF